MTEQRHRSTVTEEYGNEYGQEPKERWLKKNATFALTLALVLCSCLITYGKFESELTSSRMELYRLNVRITEVNAKVDAHHNDSSIHMDSVKWELLNAKIDGLEKLIIDTHRHTN